MKKKSLLLIPILISSFSFFSLESGGTTKTKMSFAESPEKVLDSDWITAAGETKAYIGSGEETYILGLTSSGQHGYYKHKIHVDGLDITWRAEGLPLQSTMSGFYFAPNTTQYYGKIAVSMWKGLYSKQTRVHVYQDHDYNKTSYVYQEPACVNTGFGVANSMVMSTTDEITHAGFRLRITSYNADVFQLKFTPVYSDSAPWGNNANYNEDDKSVTVYMPKSTIDCMDENGDVYLHYFGFDTNAISSGFVPYVSFSEKNINKYREESVAPTQAKLDAYKSAMLTATNFEEFEAALDKRQEYLDSLSTLRAHDQYVGSHEKLEAADADVAEVAAGFAYQQTLDKFAVIEGMIEDFTNEDNLTTSSLSNYKAALEDAKATHDTFKNLLLSDQKSDCLTKLANFDYLTSFYDSLLWILTMERDIAAIPGSSSATLAQNLDNIYSYLEENEMGETINSLNEADKAVLLQRIETDRASLMSLFDNYRDSLIDQYLVIWDSLLKEDLTNKDAMLEAIKYCDYINSRLTIVQSDVKYSTYTSLYNSLLTASENYITLVINNIDSLIKPDTVLLEEYQPVKNAYNDFVFEDFAFEESSNYQTLVSKYNALTTKVKSNSLYFFDANGVSNTQLGKNGIYFDSPGAFPARLNYNQPLSISQGINIEIINEEMAFYNDGTKANNISINFLNKNGVYKGEVGISFVIWVYQRNSNVKLYNLVDGEIGACSITTPEVGQPFTVSLKSEVVEGELTYTLKVCDGTIQVRDSFLKQCGLDICDTTYFSIGTFLDDRTYPNSFSIKKINNTDFSRTQTVEKIDNPDME